MTLTDFLLARIAEDEREQRKRCQMSPDGRLGVPQAYPTPARVLAECEARRRIVTAAISDSPIGNWMSPLTLEWVLSTLALPYADHPDYDEEWKP